MTVVPGRRFVRFLSFADNGEESVGDASGGSGVLVPRLLSARYFARRLALSRWMAAMVQW